MNKVLADWALSASVLTAAVLLLRLVFRRRISQRLMYALWLPVLLRLLLPVSLYRAPVSVPQAAERLAPAVFSPAPAGLPPEAPRPTGTAAAPAYGAPEITPGPIAETRPTARADFPGPVAETRPAPTPTPEPMDHARLLTVLWAAGAAVFALWMLAVNLAFRNRLKRDRSPFREGRTPVYVSGAVASPCLFGLLPPAIYLTPEAAALEGERLEQVLMHENMHRRQLDQLWNLLRCLALAVWWWNPLVWLAAVCSRRDGELSCDEGVLRALGEEGRLDYGRTLVDLAPKKAAGALLCAATISGGGRALKERLERIAKRPKLWLAAAVAAVLIAALAVGCSFAGKGAEEPDGPAVTQEPTVKPTAAPEPTASPIPSAPASLWEPGTWQGEYRGLLERVLSDDAPYVGWASGPVQGFELLDLSGNGVPELVLYLPGAGMSGAAAVVTWEEGELRCLNRDNALGLPPSLNAVERSAFSANPGAYDGPGSEEHAFFRYYYTEVHHAGEETGEIREGFYLLNACNGTADDWWCTWYRFGQDRQGNLTCEADFSAELRWEDDPAGDTETAWVLNGQEVTAYEYHVRLDSYRSRLQDYALLPGNGDTCVVFRNAPDPWEAVDAALGAWTPLPATVPVTAVSADPAEWLDRLFSGGEKPIGMTLMTADGGYKTLDLPTEQNANLRSLLDDCTWSAEEPRDAAGEASRYKLTLRGGGVTLDLYQGQAMAVFRAQGEERILYSQAAMVYPGSGGSAADQVRRQVFDPLECSAAVDAVRVETWESSKAITYVQRYCEAMKGLSSGNSWGIQDYRIMAIAQTERGAKDPIAIHTLIYLLPNELNSLVWWAGAGLEAATGDYEGWLIEDIYFKLEAKNGAWRRTDSATYAPEWGRELEFEHLEGGLPTGQTPEPEPSPEASPEPTPEPSPAPTAAPFLPVSESMGTDWLALPEGARLLTDEEVADWQAWFEADWMRWQFLNSDYARPQDVNLFELLYLGVDVGLSSSYSYVHPITDEDIRYSLLHMGTWVTACGTDKLPRNEVDGLLGRYLGLGLEETNKVGLSYYYLPETDCFYHAHGDTNYCPRTFFCGYALGEEVCLFYSGHRVTLHVQGEEVRFLSNLSVLVSGRDVILETPVPAPGAEVNYAGDYGRDVTVIYPLEVEDFESYEAAQASLDEIGFRQKVYDDPDDLEAYTEVVVDTFHRLLEQEHPGYGALVYGETATGTPHGNNAYLFFVTEGGRRYRLALPGSMAGDYKLADYQASDQGSGFALPEYMEDNRLVTWGMNCVYETRIGGGEKRQGGRCTWTLYLPTMEVFAYFRPEE